MICLFFDTETTGMVDWRAMASAPHQPHVVQIGAILQCRETRRVFGEMNLIIRPVGYTIPGDAAAIHGITQDVAVRFGVPREQAIRAFAALSEMADMWVAHNSDFDLKMLDCERSRTGVEWPNKQPFCTMHATTPIVAIPNTKFPGNFKWPKLQEAYKFAFGKEFDGAHDAMADVRACRDLYFWLMSRKEAA